MSAARASGAVGGARSPAGRRLVADLLDGAPDPWARIALSVVVLLLGCAALRSAWVGWLAWFPFVVTAVGAAALVTFLRRIGAAFAVVLVVALAVPLVLMEVVGRGAGLGPVESVTRPLPILLGSTYPAPVTLPLLVPGIVVAWAAGAFAGFGLRSRRFWLHPLLAGVGLVVVGDLLTAGGSDPHGLLSFGIVAAILAHWATWSRAPGEPPRALGAAALLGAIALAIGFIPLGATFQPRDQVRPEVKPSEEPNPLLWLSQWAAEPDREILRRQGDPFALHLAVLPEYDGRGFFSRSTYAPLGGAAGPSLPGGRFQIDQTVTVTWQPMSRWLPAPGIPKKVSAPDAQHDPETGTLLLPEFPQGVFSYTVTGTIDAPRLHEIAGANVGPQGRYTDLPELPPEFGEYARRLTTGSATYLEQAQAIERGLKADRHFVARAPAGSGTSIGRLRTFLFTPADRGGQAGTSEQFAAAYVLLARSVGIPTRLVVGFGSGTPLDPASRTNVVRGRDALAWPEVYFEDFGWVPFNPTPQVEEVAAPDRSNGNALPSPRPTPPGAPTAAPVPPPVPPVDPPRVPWAAILPLVALVLAAGGLLLARAARTRRQAQEGALGAWQHVRDALRLAGRTPGASVGAVAAAADAGSTPARVVAEAAERASFAPPGVADSPVWDDARLAAHELRRGAPAWRRWVWPLNPMVFRRR